MSESWNRQTQQRRIPRMGVVLSVAATIILVTILRHQLFPSDNLATFASQDDSANTTEARRGSILDATGHYLAVSDCTYQIFISPNGIHTTTATYIITNTAPVLGVEEQVLTDTIVGNDSTWELLMDDAPWDTAKAVAELGFLPIGIERREYRVYPNGNLAAPVLGFMNQQSPPQPNYGIERRYERELHGQDGEWHGIKGQSGRSMLISDTEYRPVQDGADIVLTIDRNIQLAAETILTDTISNTKATSGNLIVMDPHTGAILAMTNLPTYDPARAGFFDQSLYRNTSISAGYEPGSVVKSLTLAAALETRVIDADYTYDDRGQISMGGITIKNSDRRAHGQTDMTEMMAYSLNVGAAHLATLLGSTRFYESLRDFGFGSLTGVDLDSEINGYLRVPGWPDWSLADLGTHSYGQGILVTPLQMACAYAALANDGVLMRPHVAAELREPTAHSVHGKYGTVIKATRPYRVRRVISEETAHLMQDILVDAIEIGAPKAVVPHYTFAGKSGTSEISEDGQYTEDVVASFIGFGPLPDARFVILIKVDKPTEGQFGVDVAAPPFREMAEYLIDYYGIEPDARYAGQ